MQRLQSLSLLLSLDLDRRTFRFHDTVRHFLQDQAGKDALAALHKRLLKALDGIDADAGADEASRRYYFLHRPAHLARRASARRSTRFCSIRAGCKRSSKRTDSPQALVADYDQFGQGEVQDLIGRTLRLTSGICARDKRQLIPQLHGRLMAQERRKRDFARRRGSLSFRPQSLTCRPSLTPPGAELARLEGHGGWVKALAVLPDGRLASGSDDRPSGSGTRTPAKEPARLEGHGGLGQGAGGAARRPPRLGLRRQHHPALGREHGKELARLEGHGGSVTRSRCCPTAASPRAPMTAPSGSGTPTPAQELARLEGHGGWVSARRAARRPPRLGL